MIYYPHVWTIFFPADTCLKSYFIDSTWSRPSSRTWTPSRINVSAFFFYLQVNFWIAHMLFLVFHRTVCSLKRQCESTRYSIISMARQIHINEPNILLIVDKLSLSTVNFSLRIGTKVNDLLTIYFTVNSYTSLMAVSHLVKQC